MVFLVRQKTNSAVAAGSADRTPVPGPQNACRPVGAGRSKAVSGNDCGGAALNTPTRLPSPAPGGEDYIRGSGSQQAPGDSAPVPGGTTLVVEADRRAGMTAHTKPRTGTRPASVR